MAHRSYGIVIMLLVLLVGAQVGEAQVRQISGRVTNSQTEQGLPEATVAVLGSRVIAQTGNDGTFTLNAPDGPVNLSVRAIGFKRQQVAVPADQAAVEVGLEPDVFKLEEVVVTGQATGVERRNLANAVATVSSEELGNVPTPSVEQQLQGKVAGADIQTNSGAPGGGVQVRLRGITSINAAAEPLYVVDGVIVSDEAIPSNQNAVTAATQGSNRSLTQDAQVNRIADLNPNDIDNIEILKGASASAIYGARASNGVVIITTKRGRTGPAQVNVSQRLGFFEMSNEFGSRVFQSAEEVDATYGAGTAAANNFSPGGGFDLEKQLAGRKPLSNETSLSVSGGDENTKYFASGSIKRDGGIIENTGFKRQGVRLNLDQQLGPRFRASLSTNLLHTLAQRGLTNNDNSGTSYYVVLSATPSFADLTRQPDGVFKLNPFVPSNPLQTAALSRNDENVWRFLGASEAQWNMVRTSNQALRFIVNGGVDFFTQKNSLFFPPELQFEPNDAEPGTSLLSNSDNTNLNLNGNLVHNYRPRGGGYVATTSAGVQFARRDLDISRIVGRNLIGGQENVDAATDRQLSQQRSRVKNLGYFLQEEFLTAGERLLLTAGIRADQSSLNADAGKLFWYPKAAVSYRFPHPTNFLTELKFRGAYGESGNEPLYGQLFTPLTATANIGGLPGLVVQGTTGATDLRPERQREFEGGFDAILWNSSANVEFTVYQKNVSDLLVQRSLAPSSGFTQEFFNGAKLRTRGLEVGVTVQPLQRADVTWLFRTTFSTNRSKITELSVAPFLTGGFGTSIGAFQIEEGASATQIVGNDTLTAAEVTANPSLGAVGDIVVRKIGDANPDFRMSFTNDFTVRNFTLHFLLDWQQGSSILNLTKLLYDFGKVTADYADPIPGSTQTVGERRLAGFQKTAKNYLESATFLKLREVTLSYDLPQSTVRSLLGGSRSARLSLSARNLFTASPYSGVDPEVSNFGNQPIARNIDVAPFPPSRSFWFSVDLGL
jgi:TonB-linked SusC/RagA family outer membrane protein